MTYTEIREALIAHLLANWPADGLKLYTNKMEDIALDAAPDMFVRVVTEKTGGKQLEISDAPHRRTYGRLRATVFLRKHSGTETDVTRQLDLIEDIFKFKTLGRVHLQAPMPGIEVDRDGWYSDELFFPYFADSQ